MRKQLIKNLRIGDEVETQALILECNKTNYTAPHRAGEQFLKLVLGDASGSVKAVLWDMGLIREPIKKGNVVFVRGDVTDYHGPQVVIGEMRLLDPLKVNPAHFQPVSERDPQEMLAELREVITGEVKDPHLKLLLRAFFSDTEFVRRFALAPAARTVHHNCVSGLLEHTLEVISICRHLAGMYPELRDELLFTGAILHDIGKTEEYDPGSIGFEFSNRGKLVGHICIGKEMLDAKIQQMPSFPPDLKLELEHIILSHHGMREWGSPEIPKTLHAFALFHADLISARMNQFIKTMEKQAGSGNDWSDWDRFLERSIYLKLPGEPVEPETSS